MLSGIKLKANPTDKQKLVLSQWMGCARVIWNAKVGEEKYHRIFARKYYPVGTYAPIDTKAAHFKSKELTPWLSDCPSQIIRNSATNWYNTYRKFMGGKCGRPKIKPKTDKGSIYLTKELFRFDACNDGNMRLFIGTKTNNIGYLSFRSHGKFEIPKSLYIRKNNGRYTVSFCYENGIDDAELLSNEEHLKRLSESDDAYLENNTIGIDRGVTIPVHSGDKEYDFTSNQKSSMSKSQRYIERLQRKLAKQQKGSNRRRRTKHRISSYHGKVANIREDFAHKTSRSLVDSANIIVFEDLKTSKMTRRAKPKQDVSGQFIYNKAKQKSGLNKAILNAGWHRIESFTKYKAYQSGKAFFKIPAPHTSQECAECGHTHPDNRKSQAMFLCGNCGNTDNADRNASRVIKKRAIVFIKNAGTALTGGGVLHAPKVTGRGGLCKTSKAKALPAVTREASKKKSAA